MHLVLLFLDLDGLINSLDSKDLKTVIYNNEQTIDTYSPRLCKILNDFINRHGFEVVITSSWRTAYPFEDLEKILREQLKFTFPIIGITTDSRLDLGYRDRVAQDYKATCYDRSFQISEWLFKNGKDNTFKNYLILDDKDGAGGFLNTNNFFKVPDGFEEWISESASDFWLSISNQGNTNE